MNDECKGIQKKCLWSIRHTIPVFAFRDLENYKDIKQGNQMSWVNTDLEHHLPLSTIHGTWCSLFNRQHQKFWMNLLPPS